MSHLSKEMLYRLAGLVTWDMGFEPEDARSMQHLKQCESCYRKLCAAMAMMDAVDEFGFVEAAAAAAPRRECRKMAPCRARVEIAMRVERLCPTLEVVRATGGWTFGAGETMVSLGGAVALCPPTRLEDRADRGTFLEIDPEDGRLSIRLSDDFSARDLRATLVTPAGEARPISLGTAGGELPPLPEGNYRIILEK